MLKQIVFTMLIAVLTFIASAQNKYAILVGINDYYEIKGVKSEVSLHGSVNDANSIRDLLLHKFGFKSKNIDTLYNAKATRDNIIKALNKKLKQCKAGDAMVFYYSGHGVYLYNEQEQSDSVKKGMNQAMLTSDLYNYNDHLKCFLRDFTLKKYFNLFIDKKIVLTSIFDCCFSGKLAMANPFQINSSDQAKSVDLRELFGRLTANSRDIQLLVDSITGVSTNKIMGCKTDSTGVLLDTQDSDGDGVPDCKDKEKNTPMECLPVDSNGVGSCSFDYVLGMFRNTISKYDSAEFAKTNDATVNEKAFNAMEVLTVSEKDTIQRPADRKNSQFLFMSASTDVQKAIEFTDEKGARRSFFTTTFVKAFNNDAVNIPVENIFKQVADSMSNSKRNQTPTLSCDPSRRKTNLIGIKLKHSIIN